MLLYIAISWEKLSNKKVMLIHYSDVIIGMMVSQITSLTIVDSTIYSGVDQRKHHSFTSLAFVRGIHRWPVNSPHKGTVTRKMFPFDDIIMRETACGCDRYCVTLTITLAWQSALTTSLWLRIWKMYCQCSYYMENIVEKQQRIPQWLDF